MERIELHPTPEAQPFWDLPESGPSRARLNTLTGRISGYVFPLRGTFYVGQQAAGEVARTRPPAEDHYRRLHTHQLLTTRGPLPVAPLYATPQDSPVPDPCLDADAAAAWYAATGQRIGWVAMGWDPHGYFIGGLPAPDLSRAQRLALAEAGIRADFRTDGEHLVPVGVYAPVPVAAFPRLAAFLTKGQLLHALLHGDLAGLADDTPLVMASDAAGAVHTPLAAAYPALYQPESPWTGQVYSPPGQTADAPVRHLDATEDGPPEDAFPAIILHPVN